MTLRFIDSEPAPADLRGEVLRGLSTPRKSLPPKLLYDRRGSALFEAICETPEYYPTRTEIGILKNSADAIVAAVGRNCLLIEPGSGNCRKVRLLLERLQPAIYMPLDIAKPHLLAASRGLAADYPWLSVQAVCMDYSRRFDGLDFIRDLTDLKKVFFFPGSTIGNLEPGEALAFLRRIAQLIGPGGGLLIGVDLKKDPARLHRAYNDADGVTREFNLNLLRRLNHELGAGFDPDRFYHYAFYNVPRGRVEMHLISRGRQEIPLEEDVMVFSDGESIHTENSYKYTVEEFQALAEAAGFRPAACWRDADQLFSVQYFEVARFFPFA
jgi:dimethylhistidine N-methyltransferase